MQMTLRRWFARREFRDGSAFTLILENPNGKFTYAWGRSIVGKDFDGEVLITDVIYGRSDTDWGLLSARKLAKDYLSKWKEAVTLLNEGDDEIRKYYATFVAESELIDDE